jgi:hypothetical protein
MRVGALLLAGIAGAALGAGGWYALRPGPAPRPAPAPTVALPVDLPTAAPPPPIDAERIQSGRLTVDRMPLQVTDTLESHTAELIRTQQVLVEKQARISGTCAPGSAIRVVEADGTVVCQRFPRGAVSVAALAGVPRSSESGTAQASVPGGVGRYQTAGEDDFLVIPVALPDGALVTGFSYTYWDDDQAVDGGAYLYRSDDTMMARLATSGARPEVRVVSTEKVEARKVDNSAFAYMVFLQLSAKAGQNLMPISASVTYRVP